MYCDGCGSTIRAGMQFCNTCGKRILGTAPAMQAGQMAAAAAPAGISDRVRRNIQLLAALWLAYGVIRLLNMIWLYAFGRLILPSIFGAMGSHGRWGNWDWNGGPWGWDAGNWFLPFGLWFGGMTMAVFGIAFLLLAWGLYERRPWARMVAIILGFLILLRPPFGTALGIYTIWVLMPESSRREYEGLARA